MLLTDTKKLFPKSIFDMIGVDRFLEDIDPERTIPSFPPYDYYAIDEYNYVIEMALAGFSKNDIEVVVDRKNNRLEVYSKHKENKNLENKNLVNEKYPIYFHKGIAKRSFLMSWKLLNTVEVKSVKYDNGVLRIELSNIVPEEQKPKLIPIE
jgi:molecular chaperone IbpA